MAINVSVCCVVCFFPIHSGHQWTYLFDLIAVLLSLLLHFIPLCGALVVLVLALSSYLGCLALLIYNMYMVAFLALRILYVVALVCFVFCSLVFPLLNPFLAMMMSSAGYFHARFLLSVFFFFSRPCPSPIGF